MEVSKPVKMSNSPPMMMYPVITMGKNKTRGYFEYPYQTSLALGIVHIVLGVALVGIEIAAMVIHTPFSYIAPGIWCGLLYIADGALGITSAKRKTRAMILTFLILALVTAVVSIALFIVCPLGLEVDTKKNTGSRKLGLNGALVAIGIIGVLFNIWAAIITGKWMCTHGFENESAATAPGPVDFSPYSSFGGGQMMMMPPGGGYQHSGMMMVPMNMMPQQQPQQQQTQQQSTVTSMQLGHSMVFNPLGGVGASYVSAGNDTMGSRKSINYKNGSTNASGRGSTSM